MGVLFEAGGDTAEMLDLVEEALDEIALLVECLGKAVLFLAVGLVGYVRCCPLRLDLLAQPVRVIGFVAEQDIAFAQAGQQGAGAQKIMSLAGGQDDFDRQAAGVGEGVDLGRQSSSGAAQTMNCVVFFTLAACW